MLALLVLLALMAAIFGLGYRGWQRGLAPLTATEPAPVPQEERPVALPAHLTLEEYVASGLQGLRIMLAQHARRQG